MLSSRILLSVAAAGFGLVAGSSAQQTVDYGQLLNHKAAAQANLMAARAALASQAYQEVSIPTTGELQLTNTGKMLPVISTGNVITPVTGDGTTGKILYAPSESDDPAYRAAISAGAGGAVVDYFDTRVATPSVATLSQYDACTTWANFAYLDPTGFGNNLAAYNDVGGTVVLGAFCTYTSGNSLSGTIMTSAYCPVDSPSGTNHFTFSPYKGDGVTCIYNGVTALDCQFRDVLVTQGSGVVDGHYQDNEICHAYRSLPLPGKGECVYSNGSGAIQLGGTGQWGTAVGNSCSCPLAAINAWTDMDSALAGSLGDPKLVGIGTMQAGTQQIISLTNAVGNANAILFAAATSVPQPFKGGVILPNTAIPPNFGFTDATGSIEFRFVLPVSFPSGGEAWLQWGIQDAGAIKGVALSNAIMGLSP
ncbi:MAG TPA: hypothetical protein VFY71_12685 [Planctomycetota bacterium]|nr:hypothetical protein [Planctomycetota bacterium]